jgi:MerR family transcriptional regulator, heat shock protein HspR
MENSFLNKDINTPVYTISVAAKLLNIHPRTIMKYEREGLIKPHRNIQNNHRLFSESDLRWISCIRDIVHKEGINLKAIKYLLNRIPCWGMQKCEMSVRENCSAYRNFTKACWEVMDGICMQGNGNCEDCDVFKMTRTHSTVVKKNRTEN